MSHQRLTMRISGKVQGVYYRASAAEKAEELGVTGYAKNLPDGRVEVIAEGPQTALASLQRWCNDGPPAADVDRVDATEGPATGEFTGFETR
ncbi:acylphosphatase [Marinobacter orientalis]|uniref:acylphosphatase n=1 Tax=Marinobacter orientalis TaxID=1928859 RepID=A0A7Y0REK5_9GAMM|nr:acylphosphatase [Marinobacter orientalis]NMT64806.1 acylphosphatase [Marinobacter orientalis]TGX48797.1 acylphosphatase [Marinobacter orientalis]